MSEHLLNLHFDKSNGAIFSVLYQGAEVSCWLAQDNGFLTKKAGGNFTKTVERYASLILEAALINITSHGVSKDIWGNEVTAQDLDAAMENRRLNK